MVAAVVLVVLFVCAGIGVGITFAVGGFHHAADAPSSLAHVLGGTAAAAQDKCIVVKSEAMRKVLPFSSNWDALSQFTIEAHGLQTAGVTPARGRLAVNVERGAHGAHLQVDASAAPPPPPCARFQSWRPWLRVAEQTKLSNLQAGTFYQCAVPSDKMVIETGGGGVVHCISKPL